MKTLILVCRRDFCRILDHVLRGEGVSNYQHGQLSMVSGSEVEERVGNPAEVFVIPAGIELAERLLTVLRACPLKGRTENVFELYSVGTD